MSFEVFSQTALIWFSKFCAQVVFYVCILLKIKAISSSLASVFSTSNPSPRWTGTVLVQAIACRLFGVKPLPEPMLIYCQLDPWQKTSLKFESKYEIFIHENAFETVSAKGRPFCPGEMSLIFFTKFTQAICLREQGRRWHRTGNEPLPKPMLTSQMDLRNKIQAKLSENARHFSQSNIFRNVFCKR